VPALRGLARTWLLEAIYGPEVEAQPAFELNDGGDPFVNNANQARLNSEGLRALSFALDVVNRSKPVDLRQLGELHAQIGDWYLISGNLGRAYASYGDSWKALSNAAVATGTPQLRALLESPRVLVYRAPSASASRMRVQNSDDYAVKDVEMRLKVGKDGKVLDVVVANTAAPENSTKAAMLAARKTRFAPRIVDGEPAETEGVVLREQLMVRIQRSPQASSSDPPAATP
jgi:hypothetical protein